MISLDTVPIRASKSEPRTGATNAKAEIVEIAEGNFMIKDDALLGGCRSTEAMRRALGCEWLRRICARCVDKEWTATKEP
jgi:hypothetical protein